MDVVIAIIIKTGQLLITQRSDTDRFAGLWEFPGGKCEPNETFEGALIREIKEELDVIIQPKHALEVVEHLYVAQGKPDLHVTLRPFVCELSADAVIRPMLGQKFKWISPRSLAQYPFPQANKPLIDRLPGILNNL